MKTLEKIFAARLICVAVIDRADDAIPLMDALQAGGLKNIEITFRTAAAVEAIRAIRKCFPEVVVGAGTLLSVDNVKQAVDAGAQFGVSPGLSERVSGAAQEMGLPLFPGVVTPTEVMQAMELGWTHLKFFPAETFGGIRALRALVGPFGHTGVRFIPTGGVTAANLKDYLTLSEVAAVGGSWMADRTLVSQKAWTKITAVTQEATKVIGDLRPA